MKKNMIEIAVGSFLLIGILLMAYISINLGQVDFFKKDVYPLQALFTSVSGLKKDANVEISGVKVGTVEVIELDDYQALVTLLIDKNIEVRDDAIASVRTKGILGEKYVELTPGGSDVILKSGEMIFDTEPPFDLLSVVKDLVVGE